MKARIKSLNVAAILLALAVGGALISLLLVNPQLGFGDLWLAVTDPDSTAALIVWEFRAARIVLGVLVGVCFGLGGSLLQRLMRNPLASPDVLGVSAGASLCAMVAMVIFGLRGLPVSGAAFVGAIAIVAIVGFLAGGRGGISGRFVLIGVGVGAAVNSLIIMVTTFANTYQVREAMVWLSGSLASATWQRVSLLAALMAVLVPLVALRRRNLEVLEVGDDLAAGLGARPVRDTMIIVALVVALIASATAAAGPIAFVSFVAGPLALRLTGRWSLTLSALTGVVIVLLADAVGQILPSGPYPVGLITGALGAPVLLSVLLRKGN